MKITLIVGARPQFIKLAPFYHHLNKSFTAVILHTGQHYSDYMSRKFFHDLNIPIPDYDLEIGSASHAQQTGQMLIGIEKVLQAEKPEFVVVFGDTNSTLAGALATAKLCIPLAHVEAGLRSFNRSMPEEINRIVTDHCSDILFAPTETAVENLKKEGLSEKTHLTGDIMLDSLEIHKKSAEKSSTILKRLKLKEKSYLLLTLHRPYLVDDAEKLNGIINLLSRTEIQIVFPIHPRTRKMFNLHQINHNQNIKVIEPVGYLDFLALESNAAKIITDSGGIQKEAYLLKVPCITVRPETEWIETVETGWNVVVGFDPQKLEHAIHHFAPADQQKPIFGEFSCAEKMVNVIKEFFKNN